MLATRTHLQVRYRELICTVGIVRFDDDIARGRTVISPAAESDHVLNGTMPASTRRPGNRSRSTADIADAVLQTDHKRFSGRMQRDQIGDLKRIAAFHGDQHHGGIAEESRGFRTATVGSLRSAARSH